MAASSCLEDLQGQGRVECQAPGLVTCPRSWPSTGSSPSGRHCSILAGGESEINLNLKLSLGFSLMCHVCEWQFIRVVFSVVSNCLKFRILY